jgi:hypothetical protein
VKELLRYDNSSKLLISEKAVRSIMSVSESKFVIIVLTPALIFTTYLLTLLWLVILVSVFAVIIYWTLRATNVTE